MQKEKGGKQLELKKTIEMHLLFIALSGTAFTNKQKMPIFINNRIKKARYYIPFDKLNQWGVDKKESDKRTYDVVFTRRTTLIL